MKKLLFLLLLIPVFTQAQTRYILFVDSAGYNQISVTKLPQVAISGYYSNLIGSPSLPPVLSLTTTGSGAAGYNSTTGVLNVPTPSGAVTPTINNNVTRPINSTTFTVSTTKQAFVAYNVTISCTATIGSAATGSVALQYSTNAGSTWNTVGTVSNSNTVTLAVVLNSVQVSGLQVSGYIPANALVRLVSTTTGTVTINYLTGIEVY